jgi:hypothetical protein
MKGIQFRSRHNEYFESQLHNRQEGEAYNETSGCVSSGHFFLYVMSALLVVLLLSDVLLWVQPLLFGVKIP